jgi:hypothetical protein
MHALTHAVLVSALCCPVSQIVFEEFGFSSLLAAPAPFFSLHHICNIPVIAQPAPQQPLSIPGVPAAAAADGQSAAIDSAEAALATYGAPVRALSPAGVAALTAAKAAGAGVVIDAGRPDAFLLAGVVAHVCLLMNWLVCSCKVVS